MSTNLKISLGILFVAIVAFAGMYAKFNMGTGDTVEKEVKVYEPVVEESLSDLYNTNQLDKIIEKKKNAEDLESLIALASAYLQKGSLEFKEKDYGEKGLDIANKILAINKNSITGYSLKGYAYEIMEEYPEALKAYFKSLEIEKTSSALNQIGHVYDLMGDDKKSGEYYALAIKMTPNDVNTKMNLARVDYENKKYSEALEGFKYVYNNDVNLRRKSEAAYMLGQVYLTEELKDNKKAENYLNSAKSLDPNFPLAWVGIGQISLVKAMEDTTVDFSEQINLAINALDKAIQLNPNQTEAHVKKAEILYFMGQNNLSAEEYKKALIAVDKDITLMNNNKIEFKKFINEEIKIKKLKISSLLEDIIIAVTFPGKASAECWPVYGSGLSRNPSAGSRAGFYCSSRADFLHQIAKGNVGRDPSDSHYWNITGNHATCNNGQSGYFDGCGNGVLERGEMCDDGNVANGDGCSSTCKLESICGNNNVERGESCDDGNTYDGDGCSSTCQLEDGECGNTNNSCINGLLRDLNDTRTAYKWDCVATPNHAQAGATDHCEISRPYCGDGDDSPVEEECDNGSLNGKSGNNCSATCKVIVVSPPYYCPAPKDNIEHNNTAEDIEAKCGNGGGGGGGNGECVRDNNKTSSETCDFDGIRIIGEKEYTCSDSCKYITDDLTEPETDDLTDPTEEEVCAANPALCVNTPQGDIDVDVYWSLDKIHWNDDFARVINLKHKGEKIYIKNTPEGICNSNRGPIGLYTFNFSETDGRVRNFLQKETAGVFENSVMFTTAPTSDAPVGTVFKQKLNVNYCTSATNKTKELLIKIINMKTIEF